MTKKKKDRKQIYIVYSIYGSGKEITGASSRRSAVEKIMKRQGRERLAELVLLRYDKKTGRIKQRIIKKSLQT